MTPVDRLLSLTPDQAYLLEKAGVHFVELLGQADEIFLFRVLEQHAMAAGYRTPPVATVRAWIYKAREALGLPLPSDSTEDDDFAEAQEAVSMDDVPEVLIEGKGPLPRGKQTIPDIVGGPSYIPAPQAQAPAAVRGPAPSTLAPQMPSVLRSEERRMTPAERAMPVRATQATDEVVPAEEPRRKRQFQSFDEYQGGGRGIVPLARKENPVAPAVEDDKRRPDGTLSRTTRRGVVYPHPMAAVFGAMISLLWRAAVVASIIGLPYVVLNRPAGSPPPVREVLPWLGGLLVLGFVQLSVLERVRCRICTCHLFYSKRCTKNSKAHRFPLIGHVAALSLHLLTFQWFRCMYCGTAIRLTGDKKEGEG